MSSSKAPDSAIVELPHFINGQFVSSAGGRQGDVYNPATGQPAARVPLAGAVETARAVNAAAEALPGWADFSPLRRARILFKFRELLEQRLDDLAEIITAEHGKVLDDARGEVIRGMEVVEFACGIPHLVKGEFSGQIGAGVDSWSMRQPVGVCAGITPFNFPVMVPLWMFPVALACATLSCSSPQSATRRPACSWPICSRRPGCRKAYSMWCTATRRPSMRCSMTRGSPQ